MAFPRIGGQGIGLTNPLNIIQGSVLSAGNNAPLRNNIVATLPGQNFLIPAGTYLVEPGQYTFLQYLDPVSQNWLTRDTAAEFSRVVDSDGGNFRIANLSGCAIGALITNGGTGYTNGIGSTATGLTVTPSAGASTWVPVVGGAVASATQTAGGSNYLYPPTVVIDAPPTGGIQATASATLTSGAVSSLTITNQGAGYTTAPNITFVNDFRDGTGAGATFTTTLGGSGTLTALYPSNNGTALTAVPTFTFSPASTTAATAIMNFSVTGLTVTTAGAGYTASSSVLVLSNGGQVAGTQALTNPLLGVQITLPRMARILVPTTAGNALTATGAIVTDGGIGFQAVPTGVVVNNGVVTTQGVVTLTVGGQPDWSYIQPV